MLDVLQWLETTPIATFVTYSDYGFVIAVGVHLLGLGLSAGLIMWVDLRLLGVVLTAQPASAVYRQVAPWMLTGFTLMIGSGLALFAAYATTAYANVWFRLKVIALLLAAINAAVYHLWMSRGQARATGICSLAIWTFVIFAGCMMSYTMF